MVVLVSLLILLAMTGHSSAAYCVCRDGLSDQVLQKAIDYACGNGADCTQIQQNGPCFQPNTVKSHCDYAVNSYFQRKASTGGTCDFSGTATQTNSAPSTAGSCVFPASPGTAGTATTPTVGPPTTGNPTTVTPMTPTTTTPTPTTATPTMGTPTTGTPTMGTPTMGTPTTINPTTGSPSIFPGTTLGPSGSGISDQNVGVALSLRTSIMVLLASWFFSSLTMLRGC